MSNLNDRGQGRPVAPRPANLPDRQEADKILTGVQPMIFAMVRKQVGRVMCEDDIQEIVQKCMVHLWKNSIFNFDATRRVKMSTFLHQCARNFVLAEIRSLVRSPSRRDIHIDQTSLHDSLPSHEGAEDEIIDQAASMVVRYPERFMTPAQARVFVAMTDNPNMRKKDLAELLGYRKPSSLSMMIRRIRERIAEIDISSAGGEPDERF